MFGTEESGSAHGSTQTSEPGISMRGESGAIDAVSPGLLGTGERDEAELKARSESSSSSCSSRAFSPCAVSRISRSRACVRRHHRAYAEIEAHKHERNMVAQDCHGSSHTNDQDRVAR